MGASPKSIHLLHVDDEPDLAEMAAKFLQRSDDRLSVDSVTSASEGLDQLGEKEYDCVVSDYDMPGQNGIDFLESVREENADLPFILYTGKGSEEVASEAIHAGVTDYLQKASGTSQFEVLANRIMNVVEQHRAQKLADETEHRLQTIAENTNDILWKFTSDWDELLFINSPYEEIWGRSIDELRERPQSFLEGIHPDDRDFVKDAMGQLSAGESVDIEYRVNADEDFGRWVWVQGEPVFDDAGEVEKVVGFARDITERQDRERELERTRTKFQRVFEETNNAVFISDIENDRIVDCNQAAADLIGVSKDELRSLSPSDLHPHNFEAVEEWVETVLEKGSDRTEEITCRRPDGEIIPVEMSAGVADFDGTRCLVNNVVEITERRERESELEQQKRRFETIFENSNDAIFLLDVENDEIKDANPQAADLLGYPREELVSSVAISDVHSDHLKEFRAFIETVQEVGHGWTDEFHCKTRTDNIVEAEISMAPIELDDTSYVLANVRDITERKAHQRILENREEILRSAYEIIADNNRTVSEKIDALLALVRDHIGTAYATLSQIDNDQYEFESVATAPDVNLEAGETTDLSELPICERVFQSGQPLVLDDVGAEAPELVDPTWGIACYLGAPVFVDDEAVGTFCFYDVEPRTEDFSDWEKTFVELLSDWVGAELTRQQTHKRLQRRNKRLNKFASVVSHDLGNPLKVADGHLELARGTGESEHFDAAERALDRLNALIDDLARVMRQGQLTNELTDVDLKTVAQSCWETLDTAGASVVFEDSRPIRADENALTRLLENLIRNAVDHGGEDVTVRIGGSRHGFYVEDDGAGISEDEREDIFKPGFSTKRDGTGFGMVSVQQIALAHGWDVTVTESNDGGARFEFTDIEFHQVGDA